MTQTVETKPAPKASAPWIKLATELGPLLLFFFANARPKLFEPLVAPFVPVKLLEGESGGLFTATAVLMVAVVVALIASYWQTRKLPIMPLVTAILVVIFGALTFYLQDDRFIKMKPTVLYACFGLALGGGLMFGKSLLPIVFNHAMALTDEGWRLLTIRWTLFFFALAIANEVVWRTQSNNTWVYFKFPGTMILIFLFTMAQVPLITRYEKKDEEPKSAD